jgi:hypothetical protein
MRVYCTRLRPE